ncbi:MAG: dihydrodipicolinate synthase family protein [Anaerococcus sp.]
MSKFSIRDFKGVIPANLTNFAIDESLSEEGIREFTRFLLKFDIGGLYLTGSTGETFLMKFKERKRVVEIVMDEVQDKVPVVVHVGAISTSASIDLAKHAEAHGATGISSVPPFYWRFNEEQIFNYYKDIAEAVSIPTIIYNVPLIGLMPLTMIKKLAAIDNIKGIKYTGTDIFQISMIKEGLGDDFLVYGGADELAASNIAIGVDGIVGSFYNIIPDLFINIYKESMEGNQTNAEDLQKKALKLIMYVLGFGSMQAAMKVLLRAGGIKAGYSRRPFNNFTEDKEKEIVEGFVKLAEKNDLNDLELVKLIKANK